MNTVGKYRDQDTGRERWAVLGPTGCWYFAKRYGFANAVRLRQFRDAQDRAYMGLDPKFNKALERIGT